MKVDKLDIYLGYLSSEYYNLKGAINAESFKRYNCGVDEDIFHDTIMKSCTKVRYDELTLPQLKNYVFVSYFRNYMREQEYSRNKMKSNVEINENDFKCEDTSFEYDNIIDILIKKFGEEDVSKFIDWSNGLSVNEINKKYKCKNSRYKLDKIRAYAKEALK